MGARFDPTYAANLFMGFGEHQYIWNNNPFGANLALYAHYIDDILIIWDWSDEALQDLINYCQFTHVAASECLVLHLHAKSNHHPTWIHNVPVGQFCQILHTCIKREDYQEQAIILKRKNQEKGYGKVIIEEAFLRKSQHLAMWNG